MRALRARGAVIALAVTALAMAGCAAPWRADLGFHMTGTTICSWMEYPERTSRLLWDRLWNTTDDPITITGAEIVLPEGVTIEAVYTGPDTAKLDRQNPEVDEASRREWEKRVPFEGVVVEPGEEVTYYYLIEVDPTRGIAPIRATEETITFTDARGWEFAASPERSKWVVFLDSDCVDRKW